jgi:hypothetical protein
MTNKISLKYIISEMHNKCKICTDTKLYCNTFIKKIAMSIILQILRSNMPKEVKIYNSMKSDIENAKFPYIH